MKPRCARPAKRGRYPKGYGLPSLVVVLLLVSVLVSTIVNEVARETTEGRAGAAFNSVADRLHAFAITGGDASPLLPHLTASRDVSASFLPGAFGSEPAVLIETGFRSGRETALFEQQLRAFMNTPSDAPLGVITPGQIRRQHPERVLRDGDRMGAPIEMRDLPAPPVSVIGAGEIRAGTGQMAETGQAGTLIGTVGSLMEAPVLTASRALTEALEVSGEVTGSTGSVAGALLSPSASSSTLEVTGLLRGNEALAADTRVVGNFATDSLDNQEQIFFNEVVVSGVRAKEIQANRLSFGTRTGPEPGPLEAEVPRVDPSIIFEGRQ